MNVKFFTFSQFHAKTPVVGSTHIRVNQLIKYWNEASLYKYGQSMDVLILQKVYIADDWQWPANIRATKILDLCDPDWFNGFTDIRATIDAVDAVTCSSEGLTKHVSQLTSKPVRHIPDRFDIDPIPQRKKHTRKAQSVVWYGYSQNAELLRPALPLLEKHGLKLTVISNDDPVAYRWASDSFRDNYTFKKYDEDTIYSELQKHDICLLPQGTRAIDPFKSNNKTVKAILAGLPVAHNQETLEKYLDPVERENYLHNNYDSIKTGYDVRQSVKEMKDLIHELR